MTTSVAIAPPKSHTPTVARIGWAVLIVATLYVCYFSHLGAIGFVGPDEPRYAWVAREMAETGDWITPRLYGKPWFEKPPLYYWGAALCFKLFGVSEVSARLPSAVSALLATVALAWLAWRLYGGETARWLLLLLPTTVGMIGFSHAAATDMPFSAMLTIAMVFAAVLLGLVPPSGDGSAEARTFSRNAPASSFVVGQHAVPLQREHIGFAAAGFGFFLGLAVLAKGPAAIILCGGAVFFWALFTKRWRDALHLFHPAAIAAFCLTALPWYALCARRNPDFLRIFILEHNFKRYLTPEFQHIQPWWYYGPVVLAALLPWSAMLVWSTVLFVRNVWRRENLSDTTIFLNAWSVFCIAFFSISHSKLPGYILPAIPVVGLMLARSCTSAAIGRRSLGFTLLATGLVLLGFVAMYRQFESTILRNLVAFAPVIALSALAFALANISLGIGFLALRRPISRPLTLWGAVCPLVLLLAMTKSILSHVPIFIVSPEYLAHEIKREQIPIDKLKVSQITRSTRYGLNFYLGRELSEWDRDISHEVYLLIDDRWLPCRQQPKEMNCTDLWDVQERTDRFGMLHLSPKTLAIAPGGEAK